MWLLFDCRACQRASSAATLLHRSVSGSRDSANDDRVEEEEGEEEKEKEKEEEEEED